jgi:hypothetical protein
MIGGYDCTSCKSGGAKKKKAPVKPRRGGNSGNELFNAFKSAVEDIKLGGARKKRVKKGGFESQEAHGAQVSEMEGGAKRKKRGGFESEEFKQEMAGGAKRKKRGGFESEEFKQEMAGGAKRKRKVGRVGKGGSGTEEFQTELAGGAKKRKGAKKSLNPYIKFVKKHFQSMKKKNPNDTAPQIMKKIAVEYKKQK